MSKIPPRVFEKLCETKGWRPYIGSTILDFGTQPKAKYELEVKEANFTTIMPMERARRLIAKYEE